MIKKKIALFGISLLFSLSLFTPRSYAAAEDLTNNNFLLGITFTSYSPTFAGNTITNLTQTTDVANQHLLNFGGIVGDGCSINNGGLVGDTNWTHYDWWTVDERVAKMQTMGSHVKMITLQGAPVWMTGTAACDWDNLSHSRVLDQYIPQWADYVHYVVAKYLPQGVTHYQVWNEMKGYYTTNGSWDFPAYIKMYNAVYDRIKNDPATAQAQIGGPYAIMTQHQNGWGGNEEIVGEWGSIDPIVTDGYKQFFAQAHGYDFVAVDYSLGDVDGEHEGGSYNPNNYPFSRMVKYFGDVTTWLRARTDKPIVASEAYWGAATDTPTVLDLFRNAGGNLFLLWHEEPEKAGTLVTLSGALSDVGPYFRDYRLAHPPIFGTPSPSATPTPSTGSGPTATPTATPTNTSTPTPVPPTPTLVPGSYRDDFTSTSLGSGWVFSNPGNSSYSLSANPGHLRISVPSGSTHDCWVGVTTCARILRSTNNNNAIYTTKIDGNAIGTMYQSYGIMLWQNSTNFLRFEFWTDGGGVKVAAHKVINNKGTSHLISVPVSLGTNNALRVTKTGNNFKLEYSTNGGSTFTNAGTISQSGFTVSQAGMEVVNSGSNPANIVNFDSFSITPQ